MLTKYELLSFQFNFCFDTCIKYLIKKTILKPIRSLGFDIIRISKDFENALLGLRKYPINSVIDVGANEGQFAQKISRVFPKAHIYCFEPTKEAFKKLQKENGGDRTTLFNLALGNREGEAKMFLRPQHTYSSSFLKSTTIKKQILVSVKQTTLDKVVDNLFKPLSPEILVKMDVQGYEDRVIEGGKETLAKARACILEIGLDLCYEKQATFLKIFSLMNTLGFTYAGNLEQIYAKDGHIIYIDAVFVHSLSTGRI